MKSFFILFINIFLLSPQVFSLEAKNFETLVSTLEVEVKKDGNSINTYENVYKVLTEQGRSELSLYKVHFDETEGQFHFLEAFSVNGDKKVVTVEKAIKTNHEKSITNFGLSNRTEVIVPFDHVTIGSEVHFRYQIFQKPYVGNIFSSILGISNRSIAKKEYYKFTSEVPLFYRDDNFSPYFTLNLKTENNKFIAEIQPSPQAYAFEGVKNENAFFYVTSAASWTQIQGFVANKYLSVVSQPLPVKLQQIIKEALKQKSKKDMIEFAGREINKAVAYSGNWTTKDGKLFPQGLQQTLDKGKGDCKDYSTIMTAVLRGLGFEAYPFLTFRSQSYSGKEKLNRLAGLANPQFYNHVIVWAKDKDGKVWWIDPTNPYVQADTITFDILGNFGLLLDGRFGSVIFLPEKNSEPSDFTLEQSITLGADNSVNGTGKIRMSHSSYNSIAMLERQNGAEAEKTIVKLMLNPASKKTQLELKKSGSEKPGYDYTFHGSDWVQEQFGKYKAITIFNNLGLTLTTFLAKVDIDLGEPGTTRIITHLQGQKEVDSIRAGCLVRSKWLDADRIVENKSQEVTVTDIIKTKERFIPKSEAKGDVFDSIQSELIACARNSILILSLNEATKSSDTKELDKLKGPPVEEMTDANAKALTKIENPQLYNYSALKRFRYYEKKTAGKKADAEAYLEMGESIGSLGYINGDLYIPEHLKERIRYLDLALQSAKGDVEAKAQAKKITALLFLGDEKEANQVFVELYKKHPKHWLTFKSGFKIFNNQKKFDLAQKSLLAGEPFLKTEEEKIDFAKDMFSLYFGQKKYKEAIPYQEIVLKKNPQNPWALHNLAILYYYSDDADQCIKLEKSAIAISSFGLAESTLSDAYVKKAISVHANNQARQPSSVDSYEELLLEAIKYNGRNIKALAALGEHYLQSYHRTKSKGDLQKGRPYLNQALSVDSTSDQMQNLLAQYKKYEQAVN